MKITTVSKLRVGQKFQWIPNAWYGTGKLIYKNCKLHLIWDGHKVVKTYIYDLKYDAAVVNPPTVVYGVLGSTKVKLITKKG